jgi:hypothetical protein
LASCTCRLIRFSGVERGEACTIVLRGASQHVLDEAERSMHDALCVLTQASEAASELPQRGHCGAYPGVHARVIYLRAYLCMPVGGPAFPRLHRLPRANDALRSPIGVAAQRRSADSCALAAAARSVLQRSAACCIEERGAARPRRFLLQTVRETRTVLGGGCSETLMAKAVDEVHPPVRQQTHARARRVHTRARANEWPGRGRLA